MTTTTASPTAAVNDALRTMSQRLEDGRETLDADEVAEIREQLTSAAAADTTAAATVAGALVRTGQGYGGTTSVSTMVDLLLDLRLELN